MDLGPEARRLLELTRAARTPSDGDRARVERRIAAALPLVSPSSPRSGWAAVKAKLVAAPLAKLAIGSLGIAAIASIAYWRRPARPSNEAAPAVVATEAPAVVETAAPIVDPPTVVPAAVPEPMFIAPATPVAPHRAHAKPTASGTLPEEIDLLHDAQAKWRAGDAPGALALLSLHRERYPHSELAPERDALRVLSLCATGNVIEARRVAKHFLERSPRSPLRASIEESCAL
ncbi:MAG TPA: hypothetical protein VGL13_15670, partial [Polyangiaceae bacterium]